MEKILSELMVAEEAIIIFVLYKVLTALKDILNELKARPKNEAKPKV